MTMIVAYTWKNKIVMMADSRKSTRNEEGKMLEYSDKENKIIPVQNKLVIGHSGLKEVDLGCGQYFDLHQITEHFIKVNRHVISKATGQQLLTGLVEMWNRTLHEKLNRNPFSIENRFCLVIAKFEENEFGDIFPTIHTYQSHLIDYNWDGNKVVVGDDDVYPIMMPYYKTKTDMWTFEDTLSFYKKGYKEVIDTIETVGGPIDIYVLEKNPDYSYWLEHKKNTK